MLGRATISDYSQVGKWCIIGEMALVRNGQQIPPGKIAVGVPARVVGDVSEEQRRFWTHGKDLYIELAGRYPDGLKEIDLAEALEE